MRIEFDPAKDSANQTKHGVSLALAGELDWEAALVWVDDRFEYAELRMIALAPRTNILYCVAFVDRGTCTPYVRAHAGGTPFHQAPAFRPAASNRPSCKTLGITKSIRCARLAYLVTLMHRV